MREKRYSKNMKGTQEEVIPTFFIKGKPII